MLTSFVSGGSWVVTYYQQLLAADNAPAAHDPTRKAPFQQYNKIQNMELLVTQPLTYHQNPQSKEFEVTGAATVYGFLIANKDDVFLAQADDGRMAIFQVTSSEKTTFMKRANYAIEYQLLDYADSTRVNDLDAKTQLTYQFVKSMMGNGQSPLLTSDQYATYTGLQQLYVDLTSVYFRDFFSNSRQTLLVPDQPFETYDHWLSKAMVDIVGTDESLTLPKIRLPMTGGDLAMKNVTVWDSLLQTNKIHLLTGIQRAGITPTVIFRNIPYLTGIYYTGIDQIVYPKDDRTDVDAKYGYVEQTSISGYQGDGTPRFKSLERLFADKDQTFFNTCCQCVEKENGTTVLPPIVPVTQDDFYVFTQPFYQPRQQAFSSQLEKMAWTAINQQPISPDNLLSLGGQAFGWPNLERFYYVPVILALIKVARAAGMT